MRLRISQVLGRRLAVGAIAGALAAKILLAMFAPPSYDFIFTLSLVIEDNELFLYAPWRVIENVMFSAARAILGNDLAIASAWRSPPFAAPLPVYAGILILKLPAILLDAATGLLLYGIARKLLGADERPNAALLVLAVWMINPLNLLAAELIAGPDILAVFLIFLAIYLFIAGKWYRSFGALFLAIAVKFFGVILAPVLAVSFYRLKGRTRKLTPLLLLSVLGVVFYIYWLTRFEKNPIPFFFLMSPITQPWIESVVRGEGTSGYIGLATILLGLFYFTFLEKWPSHRNMVLEGSLAVFLLYFVFGLFNVSYLLWLTPFFTLDLVVYRRGHVLQTLILGVGFLVGSLSGPAALYGTPNGYNVFFLRIEGILVEFVSSPYAGAVVLPVLRSVLSALCLVYVGKIILGRMNLK